MKNTCSAPEDERRVTLAGFGGVGEAAALGDAEGLGDVDVEGLEDLRRGVEPAEALEVVLDGVLDRPAAGLRRRPRRVYVRRTRRQLRRTVRRLRRLRRRGGRQHAQHRRDRRSRRHPHRHLSSLSSVELWTASVPPSLPLLQFCYLLGGASRGSQEDGAFFISAD